MLFANSSRQCVFPSASFGVSFVVRCFCIFLKRLVLLRFKPPFFQAVRMARFPPKDLRSLRSVSSPQKEGEQILDVDGVQFLPVEYDGNLDSQSMS